MSNVKEIDADMMVFGVTIAVESLRDFASKPGANRKLLPDLKKLMLARDLLNKTIVGVSTSARNFALSPRIHKTAE